MTTAIVNRVTGEVLHVELEIGDDLWLSSEQNGTERAKRSHFPPERWEFEGVSVGVQGRDMSEFGAMNTTLASRCMSPVEVSQ